MTYRITAGNRIIIEKPYHCSYCQLDTAGNHQGNCPLANRRWKIVERSKKQ